MEFTNLSYQSPEALQYATEIPQQAENSTKIDLSGAFSYPETSDEQVSAQGLQYPVLTENLESPDELRYPESTRTSSSPQAVLSVDKPAGKSVTFQDELESSPDGSSTPPPPYSEKLRSYGSGVPVECMSRDPVKLSARQLAYYQRDGDEVRVIRAQSQRQMKDIDEKKRKGVIAILVFIFLFVLVFNVWYFASRVKII